MSATSQLSLRKYAAVYGLFLGAVVLLLATVPLFFYVQGNSLFLLVFGPLVSGIVIPLAAIIFFAFRLRLKMGGYWSFRQAATGIFIMLGIALLLMVSGRLVFDQYIAADLKVRFEEKRKEASIQHLRDQGATAAQIIHQEKEIKAQTAQKPLSLNSMLISLPLYIIFCFFLSLLFAMLLKREKPVYYNMETEEIIP